MIHSLVELQPSEFHLPALPISQIFSSDSFFRGNFTRGDEGTQASSLHELVRFSAPTQVIQMLIEHQADVNHGGYGGAALPLTCLAVPADGNWDQKC